MARSYEREGGVSLDTGLITPGLSEQENLTRGGVARGCGLDHVQGGLREWVGKCVWMDNMIS